MSKQRQPLLNFLRASWRDQGRILEAMGWLALARGLIRFVPFRYWKKKLGRISADQEHQAENQIGEDQMAVAWSIGQAVRRAAAHAPFQAVCLPQAMAGRWMLNRRSIPNQLFIGARPNAGLEIVDLHAWLCVDDLCLTGQHERSEFKPFNPPSSLSDGLITKDIS